MPTNKHVVILAGEASGDDLGAALVSTMHTFDTNVTFSGMGGTHMADAGVDLFINSDELAIVGAWEVITHINKVRRTIKTIKRYLQHNKIDLIILIDYPGLNLRMAKLAKSLHIPVLFYVSPQVWAWRSKRIHTIKKHVDHMLLLFSFEQKIYQQANIPNTFVGHPLLERINITADKASLYSQYQLNPKHPIIALLPGSRQQEIKRLLPTMISASKLIQQQYPNAQFILPIAASLTTETIQQYCPEHIIIAQPPLANILQLCQAAIVTSGTATLETALCQIPMVIIYKTSWLTYFIGKHLVTLDKIGLSNIVGEKMISQELIQHQANPENITKEIINILDNTNYRQQMINDFATIKAGLGSKGASNKAAQVVVSMLNQG